MNKELEEWIHQLCDLSKKDDSYYQDFINQLNAYPELFKELSYYAYNGDFLCEYAIEGYTIIDILVWQIDHFKSHMDRGEYNYQSNPEFMVLMAFETMLKMMKDPKPFILALTSETGTDYAEKY